MIPALLLITLAACTNGAEPQAQLDPKEAQDLAKALDGKVAGKPVSCVSLLNGTNLRPVGNRTLLYRVNKKLTYRNDLNGACYGLRDGDTLVMHVYSSQYCRGDIAHVINLTSGIMSGSCVLGDFVPYTTAAGG
ncbi:MAG: hypothetical protein J7494_00360 [Sphingobium sp.]|nr:hypothetical protein [Sphingobium sp.]